MEKRKPDIFAGYHGPEGKAVSRLKDSKCKC